MDSTSMRRFGAVAALSFFLFACKLGSLFGGGDEDGSGSSPTATGAGPSLGGGPGKVGASGRSAVPTVAEWNGATEVTVKGSSALGCSTKMLREWFRVSCSGKNDTGGTPTTVSVTRGGGAERFTFAQNGVTSLVMPFVEGTDVDAQFSWTDKSHKLVARWPRGAPRPGVVATFEGASSPLDRPACGDCMSEGDAQQAKAQGKSCCPTKKCKTRGDCGSQVCCVGAMGDGVCRGSCDIGNTNQTCSSDAECPTMFGKKLTCKPHSAGGRACR